MLSDPPHLMHSSSRAIRPRYPRARAMGRQFISVVWHVPFRYRDIWTGPTPSRNPMASRLTDSRSRDPRIAASIASSSDATSRENWSPVRRSSREVFRSYRYSRITRGRANSAAPNRRYLMHATYELVRLPSLLLVPCASSRPYHPPRSR